jgi:chorismate mutase
MTDREKQILNRLAALLKHKTPEQIERLFERMAAEMPADDEA